MGLINPCEIWIYRVGRRWQRSGRLGICERRRNACRRRRADIDALSDELALCVLASSATFGTRKEGTEIGRRRGRD